MIKRIFLLLLVSFLEIAVIQCLGLDKIRITNRLGTRLQQECQNIALEEVSYEPRNRLVR